MTRIGTYIERDSCIKYKNRTSDVTIVQLQRYLRRARDCELHSEARTYINANSHAHAGKTQRKHYASFKIAYILCIHICDGDAHQIRLIKSKIS